MLSLYSSSIFARQIKNGKRKGLSVIAVVRRDEQAKKCLEAGAVVALNSTSETFFEDLKEACAKHKATVCFDAVAGELAGTVLAAMPNGSTMHVYGGLSEDRPVISTRDLIFKKKTVTGFWLKDFVAENKWQIGLLQWMMQVPHQLLRDFESPVAKTFKLSEVHDAILAYSKDMGAGKIVLLCDETLTEAD